MLMGEGNERRREKAEQGGESREMKEGKNPDAANVNEGEETLDG